MGLSVGFDDRTKARDFFLEVPVTGVAGELNGDNDGSLNVLFKLDIAYLLQSISHK